MILLFLFAVSDFTSNLPVDSSSNKNFAISSDSHSHTSNSKKIWFFYFEKGDGKGGNESMVGSL